jgi:hypothetical protein
MEDALGRNGEYRNSRNEVGLITQILLILGTGRNGMGGSGISDYTRDLKPTTYLSQVLFEIFMPPSASLLLLNLLFSSI